MNWETHDMNWETHDPFLVWKQHPIWLESILSENSLKVYNWQSSNRTGWVLQKEWMHVTPQNWILA
jgi:hypothetical protein